MSEECIHGFEDGLCAVCSPPPSPQPTSASRAAKAPRKAATSTRPVTRRNAPGAGSAKATTRGKIIDVAEQRLYHVTHVDNLSAIIESGRLLADTGGDTGAEPVVDIAAPETRRVRRETPVPGQDATVADYVPFYLSPDARLWNTIRTKDTDPRVSAEAASWAARDFVVLVTVAKDVFASDADSTEAAPYSVTDGDATGSLTRFGTGSGEAEKSLRSLRSDDGAKRILEAEFLVKDDLPFELVSLIGVCNERVRDEVKAKLKEAGYRARVAVYPPWFQAAEAESA